MIALAGLEQLIAAGPTCVLAVTILLAAGWLGGSLTREPIDRQRWSELAVLGSVLIVPLLIVPLPRLLSVGETVPAPEHWIPRPADAPVVTTHAPLETATVGERATPTPLPATQTPALGPWLAGGYLVLVGLLLVRVLLGALRLQNLLRAARVVPPQLLPTALPEGVELRATQAAISPFCAGLRRFVIVVPESLLADDTLTSVIDHELAHVGRRDPWSHWLFALALPWLALHPLFWLLRRRAQLSAEIVADEIAASSGCRRHYAERLLDLATHQVAPTVAPIGAVPVFRRRSELSRRIEMLIDDDRRPSHRSSKLSFAVRATSFALIVGAVASSFGTELTAQDPGRAWTEAERRAVLQKNAALKKEVQRLRAQARQATRQKPNRPVTTMTAPNTVVTTSPERTVSPKGYTKVKIRQGDTLASLAKRHLGSVRGVTLLHKANPNLDPKRLTVGTEIVIPKRRANTPLETTSRNIAARNFTTANRASTTRMTDGRNRTSMSARSGRADDLALLDRVMSARTDLALAQAKLGKLATKHPDNEVHRIKVDAAERRYALLRDIVEFELRAAKVQVQQAKERLSRTMALRNRNFITATQVRGDELALERAEFRLVMLRSALR